MKTGRLSIEQASPPTAWDSDTSLPSLESSARCSSIPKFLSTELEGSKKYFQTNGSQPWPESNDIDLCAQALET